MYASLKKVMGNLKKQKVHPTPFFFVYTFVEFHSKTYKMSLKKKKSTSYKNFKASLHLLLDLFLRATVRHIDQGHLPHSRNFALPLCGCTRSPDVRGLHGSHRSGAIRGV